MKMLHLPSGISVPVLGQGTWKMGEDLKRRGDEIAALRHGLDLGMSLIDTAEMYAEGGAEEIVAEAIVNRRAEVFLVSKVYPHNATRQGTIAACDRSLRRLKTDYLDLYLLHWRGSVSLAETLEAFKSLKQSGKIRDYGVSNFDIADMEKVSALSGGEAISTNQVLYNLIRRGIEWDLLPWCRAHGLPIIAYSPIEQGRMIDNKVLQEMAQHRGVTPAQLALAWLLHQEDIIAIPKSSDKAHIEQNRTALDLRLTIEELTALDKAFPPPSKRTALEML